MTYQPSFSQAEFADKKKITRREKFLARMEEIIPWLSLLAVLEPFYPKGERGRPPIGLERMLRMYFRNQWYFGMKAHIGADRDSKLVHTMVVTAANVADITKTAELLHGQETQVHADAGYTGVEKRAEITVLDRPMDWQIAGKRGQIKTMAEGPDKETRKALEKAKAS